MSVCGIDKDTKSPTCQPLSTLDDVLSWKPDATDDYCRATVPLTRRDGKVDRPQTLDCHDMAGGYLDDRFIQGSPTDLAYRFYHWQYLDSFIYFSHHFITIPPPCWTNAAHKHRVKMLGTLITEWDDGKERCKRFLETEHSYKELVHKLVEITQFYGFDGWLVNIENVIEEEQVGHLVGFVEYLRVKLQEVIPGSEVMWYDSVIRTGQLKWQDSLNEENMEFYNASDSLFLNYCWDKEKLAKSKERTTALARPYDVFVGVDVFGRGCMGGGGYHTNVALEAAREQELSAAIFAPGWVWEKHDKSRFTHNENKFWGYLDNLCHIHSVDSLPIGTSFCQGFGNHFYVHGKMVSEDPWTNLSCQAVQLSYTAHHQFGAEEAEQEEGSRQHLGLHTENVYLGGGCLMMSGSVSQETARLKYRLLKTNIKVQEPLLISYTFKNLSPDLCDLHLHLTFEVKGVNQRKVLAGDMHDGTDASMILPLSTTEVAKYSQVQVADKETGWVTRTFVIETCDDMRLTEVGADLLRRPSQAGKCRVLLGLLQVMEAPKARERPLVTGLRITDQPYSKGTLKMLRWDFPEVTASHYLVYMSVGTHTSYKLLGATHTSMYTLPPGVPKAGVPTKLVVQPVCLSGYVMPFCELPVLDEL